MAPNEPKISKQKVAGTKRHITFTTPETLEVIRKPGSATSQWIVNHLWYKETRKKLPVRT